MGMFDYYQPTTELRCPESDCGLSVDEWQGKNGPRALATFREGESTSLTTDGHGCLPATFTFHGWCENDHWVEGVGHCINGVWLGSEIDYEAAEPMRQAIAEGRVITAKQFIEELRSGDE